MAGTGMHHEARRLVDHDDVEVFVDDGQRNRRVGLDGRLFLVEFDDDLVTRRARAARIW